MDKILLNGLKKVWEAIGLCLMLVLFAVVYFGEKWLLSLWASRYMILLLAILGMLFYVVMAKDYPFPRHENIPAPRAYSSEVIEL